MGRLLIPCVVCLSLAGCPSTPPDPDAPAGDVPGLSAPRSSRSPRPSRSPRSSKRRSPRRRRPRRTIRSPRPQRSSSGRARRAARSPRRCTAARSRSIRATTTRCSYPVHEDRPGERGAGRDPRGDDELGDVVAAGGGVAKQREDGGRVLGRPGLRGEHAAVVGFAAWARARGDGSGRSGRAVARA